jgi:hypothetical protein
VPGRSPEVLALVIDVFIMAALVSSHQHKSLDESEVLPDAIRE